MKSFLIFLLGWWLGSKIIEALAEFCDALEVREQ